MSHPYPPPAQPAPLFPPLPPWQGPPLIRLPRGLDPNVFIAVCDRDAEEFTPAFNGHHMRRWLLAGVVSLA